MGDIALLRDKNTFVTTSLYGSRRPDLRLSINTPWALLAIDGFSFPPSEVLENTANTVVKA